MRTFKRILFIALIVFVSVYALIYAFLAIRGKKIIVDQIKHMIQRKVEIGAVHMALPFTIKLDNISIDSVGKASAVELSPSLMALMTGKMAFNSVTVIKPELTFSMPVPQPQPAAVPLTEAAAPQAAVPVTDQPAPRYEAAKAVRQDNLFMFRRLRIVDGTIIYADPSVSADTGGIKIVCNDVQMDITNIYESPNEIVTKFALTAFIPWKDSQERGTVSLEGWMNYFKKDMRAELVLKDIDALYLYPYYANWFSLDRSSIEKAKLAFTSSVTGLNNDVTAACHLELTELSFKKRDDAVEQSKAERFTNKVLDFFKAMNNGKVVLNFSIKTKMDSPDFGMNVIKNAFDSTILQARKGQGSAAAKVMEMPGQVVGGTVKGVSDVSSALIGGAVSVGKELGKSIGLAFKKEPHVSEYTPDGAVEPTVASEQHKPVPQAQVNETLSNTANNTTVQ